MLPRGDQPTEQTALCAPRLRGDRRDPVRKFASPVADVPRAALTGPQHEHARTADRWWSLIGHSLRVSELPYPTAEERLRDSIRTELQVFQVGADLALDDVLSDELANCIADNIEYAFAERWVPRWVKEGQPRRWTEPLNGEPTEYFVDCVTCRRLTAHPSAAEADAWYEQHARQEHT